VVGRLEDGIFQVVEQLLEVQVVEEECVDLMVGVL
tara:strand:- start:380 stop:484 length:105 start_codon:yes stop_codon:yes gene_type:complete